MPSKSELESMLIDAYEKRYGKGSVIRLQYNGTTEPKGIYHHWQLWYKDDNGIVRCNSNIYAISFDGKNFEWYGSDPTNLPSIPKKTFTEILQEKINELAKTGKITYAEIINSDENLKKARVFIKTDTEEGVYIVWIDQNGNLQKVKTAFER